VSARRRHLGGFRWEGVALAQYKGEAAHFRDVTRQALFADPGALPCELRYFEVAPGGHTTLERHAHAHAVVVVRGGGRALVGEEIVELAALDLIQVPPRTWHQFRAGDSEPLGFLCLVASERDRPEQPDARALARLCERAEIRAFVRSGPGGRRG
jgi:quercetin dioxygenase-like cupin family protein